jgi:CheY-like chemotaxis protein
MPEMEPEIFQAAEQFFSDLSAAQRRKNKSAKSGIEDPSILVVDDQHIIADSTAEILNMSGFRAVKAYDGKTALQMATELHPDYLLTDVLMPSMNGVELAIAIRKILPKTSILLFSGQAGTADILEKARKEGHAFDLVAKPIHPEKLVEHLKRTKG